MISVFIALIVVTCLLVVASVLVFLLKRDATLEFVQKNSEIVKISLIVVAGLYTAWIYYVEMRDQRIANALSYQGNAATPYMREAFETLDMLWIRGPGYDSLNIYRNKEQAIISEYEDIGKQKYSQEHTKAKYRKLTNLNRKLARTAASLVRSEKLEDEVFRIYDHYYDIVTCANRGRCHWQTACELYSSEIEKFRLDYRVFLVEWDRLWHEKITKGLRNFYFQCKGKSKKREKYVDPRRRGRLGIQHTQRNYTR